MHAFVGIFLAFDHKFYISRKRLFETRRIVLNAFTGLVYEMLQFEPLLTIMQSDISGVVDGAGNRI